MAIRKLNERDYLKRLNSMTLRERREYMGRVGEWLRNDRPRLARCSIDLNARLQSVVQLSAGWTEQEQQAFHKGARLLTALIGLTDTWLPEQLYMKSAKRSIYKMAECLVRVSVGAIPMGTIPAAKPQGTQPAKTQAQRLVIEATKEAPLQMIKTKSTTFDPKTNTVTNQMEVVQAGPYKPQGQRLTERKQTANESANKPANGQPQDQGAAQVTTPLPLGEGSGERLSPMRPKHIDQYAHLLPKATQERAAKVGDLLRELDTARENARKLMEAGEQGDKIAAWAKRATTLDNTVGKIYRELDAEWENLVKQGRVGVDAFGNAFVTEGTEKTEGTEVAQKPELTDEQKKRLKSLQSFLREKRIGKDREKHIQKWKEYYRELVRDFGTQYVTESACAIAETLGINLKELKN